ncbi:6-bladed beta-propeller [Neolewinella agarilytica]|nr:6-bladed beta-propeller [Neolewinella agarilytica]
MRLCWSAFMFFTLLVALAASCESGGGGTQKYSFDFKDYKVTKGNDKVVFNASELFRNIVTINLTRETAEKVGNVSSFMLDASQNVILVDKIFSIISSVSMEGDIIWQLTADPTDFRVFNDVRAVYYNYFDNTLIVQSIEKIYTYNQEGKFVDVEPKPVFNFNRMAFVAPDEVVYSCQGRLNTHVLDRSKQLIWTVKGQVENSFITSLPYAPEHLLIGGVQEFSLLNESLYYHAPFRDTIYSVNLPEVRPEFSIKFEGTIRSEEVMKKESIRNKLKYMREESVPQLMSLAADSLRLAFRYKVGHKDYFGLIDRKSNEMVVNHRYLKYNQLTIEPPQMYHDGHFLRIVPDYQVKHFAKIDPDATEVSKEWLEELKGLDEAYNDVGPKTLYLIKL